MGQETTVTKKDDHPSEATCALHFMDELWSVVTDETRIVLEVAAMLGIDFLCTTLCDVSFMLVV